MLENICLLITVLTSLSREIRGWIALRKREKDDDSHPPFLIYCFPIGTIFYT